MCFIEDNKYYIQQNLHRPTSRLSLNERQKYYETIKQEVRRRINYSHQKCVNRAELFQDIFEVLSDYESDYLVLNLFYEKDSITIINSLTQRDTFKDLLFKESSQISALYYSYVTSILKVHKSYQNNDELFFLKSEFLRIVPEISVNDWNSGNENNSLIASKFTKWLFNSLKEDMHDDIVCHAFYLFVKIWNCFEFINNPFNIKAILLYSYCISECENISNPQIFIKIHKYFLRLRSIFSTLFVNFEYVPLLDTKESAMYKPGYVIKRELFQSKLKQFEKTFTISENKSILSLLESINSSESLVFHSIVQMTIEKRINNYEMPTPEELIMIKEMDLVGKSGEIRTYLFKRLYLFEFI